MLLFHQPPVKWGAGFQISAVYESPASFTGVLDSITHLPDGSELLRDKMKCLGQKEETVCEWNAAKRKTNLKGVHRCFATPHRISVSSNAEM